MYIMKENVRAKMGLGLLSSIPWEQSGTVGILATQTPGVPLARKTMGAMSGNSDATVVHLV